MKQDLSGTLGNFAGKFVHYNISVRTLKHAYISRVILLRGGAE